MENLGLFFEGEVRSIWGVKKLKAMVEKTTNFYIKTLQLDRGGEYMSLSQSIVRNMVSKYSWQHDTHFSKKGVSERKKLNDTWYGLVNVKKQKHAKGNLGRRNAICCVCAKPMCTCKIGESNTTRSLEQS